MHASSTSGAGGEVTQQLNMSRDGLSLRADRYGPEDGAWVILLHGFPDTPRSWHQVLPILVSAGYQVLAPWLRSYTRQSARRDAEYGLLPAAEDIRAWMAQLQIPHPHLVGHDWGAAIAMALDSLAPGKWLSISLLAVPPAPSLAQLVRVLPTLPRQLLMSRYMLTMRSNRSGKLLSRDRASYVKRLWQRWSPTRQFDESEFQATREVFSQPEMAHAAARYYRSLFGLHRRRNREAAKHMLAPLRARTLALAGLDDGCMSVALHRRCVGQPRDFPNRSTVYLPGCGHFLQAEQPEAVARAVLAHFEACSQALG